ncbi:MAG TPA: ATP-binding protein [Polyangiaceae bacterium]|jgi:signal transduction histidine kinase/ActR/RegA family two-component response regulator|nr:ATP-binding protein [Polyangiaceae bacterium]
MGRPRAGNESDDDHDPVEGLADALPDALLIVDELAKVLFVNQAAEELLGHERQGLLGQPSPFPVGERAPKTIEVVAAGRTREGELRVVPVDWRGQRAFLVSIREVTGQHAQQERRKRAEELEAVGRLAGGIAHDFNNLLTGIMTFTTLVRDTFTVGDERRTDLDQVLSSGQRAVELTRNLLAFSRREPSAPRQANLNTLITRSAAALQKLLGDGIELERDLAPNLWSVLVDAAHFDVMLTKLVVNALDAMPEGGTLRIETRNDDSTVLGECVLCRVSDSGHGMSDDVKQKVFHPFFTTKALGKGTGLGLATVYGLLLQAKGTIEVDSVVGRGTTFDMRFPRAQSGPQSMRPQSLPVESHVRGTREAILLAEDEPIVRQSVGRMLRRGGYTFFEARSGREALEVFADHRDEIGLALLDVVMPELSGPETALRLRSDTPDVKILFMSGYPRDLFDTNEEARDLGPLIQKPMTEAALLGAIRRLLATETKEERAESVG